MRWKGKESEKADRRKEVIIKVHLHSAPSFLPPYTHTPTHTDTDQKLLECQLRIAKFNCYITCTGNNAVQLAEWLVYTACSLLPETKNTSYSPFDRADDLEDLSMGQPVVTTSVY